MAQPSLGLAEAAKQVASGNAASVSLEDRLELAKKGPTLIFDGVCNLCNASMRWYHDRLRPEMADGVYLMWAQHEDTQAMLKSLGIRPDDIMKSWAYVADEVVHRGSSAWFQAMTHLKQPWRTLSVLNYVPELLREGAYGVVAKNRYRALGKSDVCQRPAPSMKRRFLHAPTSSDSSPKAVGESLKIIAATPRLLVIGLGPAGLNVTRSLYSDYDIIAVEPRDYFEFTPGILRGAVDPKQLDGLQVRYKDALKGMNVQHVRGEVVKLFDSFAEVKLHVATDGNGCAGQPGCVTGAEGELVAIPFDYAIIAAGSQYAPGGGWKVTAADGPVPGMTLQGRRSEFLSFRDKLLELKQQGGTAIVVGSGLVGVELAAEIAHYIPGLKVVLNDCAPVVLKPLPKGAQDYAASWLERHGVELKLGKRLPAGGEAAALGISGSSRVLLCAGIKMRNSFAEPLACLDERGSVRVNRMMQVLTSQQTEDGSPPAGGRPVGAGRIFALGDCVAVEGINPPLGKLVYPADAMADVVVTNLRRARTVQCLRTCPGVLRELREKLMCPAICSLGPHDAVFVMNDSVVLKGRAAAAMKHLIETTKMSQFRQERLGCLVWSLIPHL